MGKILRAEYEARLLTTNSNLRAHFNDCLGVIFKSQDGKITEDEAREQLDALDEKWAMDIVNDLAPMEHIIRS